MLNLDIMTVLHCSTSSEIETPNVSDWSEIKDWFVKWDSFHYTLDGETWEKPIELYSEAQECIDWKRPINVRIRKATDDLSKFGDLLADEDY